MGRVSIALMWAWGLGVLALDAFAEGGRMWPDVSRAGWVMLPWMALAGLPGRRSPESALSVAAPLAGILPLVVVAARMDLASGAPADALARALAGAALLALLGSAGAAWKRAEGRRLHGQLWCVWAIGIPLIQGALAWTSGGAPGAPLGTFVGAVARATPLAWCHAWTRADGLANAEFPVAAMAIAVALLAWSGGRGRVLAGEPA